MIKETCCPSLESVKAALERKTSRIELCERLDIGGITPSRGLIEAALSLAGDTPINVLIRPRGGSFVYSREETERMIRDIHLCLGLGVNGVVIGALLGNSDVDKETVARLLEAAGPLDTTFHRAIDESRKLFDAMEDIISLGVKRILSSGHRETAALGKENLRRMVELAGDRIIIMPGCGITPENLDDIASYTRAREFHGSRL